MPSLDPYIDETTGDLRNLLGATNPDDLKEREAQTVFANEITLYSSDIPRTNDLNEVCAIHQHLFDGVYDWAGKIRTVDIMKNDDNSRVATNDMDISKLIAMFDKIVGPSEALLR